MAAGGSAAEQAQKKRDQAERLRREAERWERGAEGERRVATLLAELPSDFVVFHDVRLPNSRANVDHLVVGPSGVWAVDAKYYSNPVTMGRGRGADTLWTARTPMRRVLDRSRWEAETVGELVGLPVRPLMCIIAPSLPQPVFEFAGVRICAPHRLVSDLTASLGGQIDVGETSAKVQRVFGVRPEPARRAERPNARQHEVSSVAPRRLGRPIARDLKRAARLALLGAGLVVFFWLLPALASIVGSIGGYVAEEALDRLTPTTVVTAPAATDASPAPSRAPRPESAEVESTTVGARTEVPVAVDYVVTCPTQGAGWVVDWVWPGEPPSGAAGYLVHTQRSEVRLSHTPAIWSDPASPPAGIRVNSAEFVVITTLVDDQRDVLATVQESFAAPAWSC